MSSVYDYPVRIENEVEVRYQSPRSTANQHRQVGVNDHEDGSGTDSTFEPYKEAAAQRNSSTSKMKLGKKWKMYAAFTTIVLLLVMAAVVLIAVKIHQPILYNQTETNVPERFSDDYLPTCLALKDSGYTESGYYAIQPDLNDFPFSTFCDMETSGGGWTLIASIHENDINGKCTTADNWFSNDEEGANGIASRNWQNKNIFGKVTLATSNDYKNSGYYSMKASDLLIKHMDNGVHLNASKEAVVLEYHTNNGFLEEFGGNLYTIYNDYHNLSSISQQEIFITEKTTKILDALTENADDIISHIPDFYRYEYDTSPTSNALNNAGRNMFTNYGMRVTSTPCSTVIHGQNQTCIPYNDVTVGSRRTYPFFAIMVIGSNENRRYNYYLRVQSYRPNSDNVESYDGTITNGQFTMQYRSYCRYQSSTFIPSLCDVFYVVSNEELWSSEFVLNPSIPYSSSNYYTISFDVRNYPKNIVFGYIMLSRNNGTTIQRNETEQVLEKMLAIFKQFPSIAKSCKDLIEPGLVQPIEYIAGEKSVLGDVPTSLRDVVTPGYMQFWARNYDGGAFAFCPAVRVNTCRVESLCVGGVYRKGSNNKYCSDFANWNYGSSFANLDEFNPGSYSRSQHYIETTILMFYR